MEYTLMMKEDMITEHNYGINMFQEVHKEFRILLKAEEKLILWIL